MMSRRRLLLFLLMVLIASLCLAGCRRGTQPHVPDRTQPQDVENTPGSVEEPSLKAQFKGASITWRDAKGIPVWEAHFQEALASQEGNEAVVELRGVKADLYTDGKVATRLIAPLVTADSRTGEVIAEGDVQLSSALHDASARCERLTWRSRENTLIGTGGVRMSRQNMSIASRSFTADTALRKVRFTDASMNLQ